MKIVKAIQSLRPNGQFTMNDEDLSTIVWYTENTTTPTKEEIDNEIIRLDEEERIVTLNKADAKLSAQAKLAALGLSSEEISAITNN